MLLLISAALAAPCALTETFPKWSFSGVAPEGPCQLLVVNDVKGSGDRLGRVRGEGKATLTPVPWTEPFDVASDIEAIAAVPGAAGRYALLASKGTVFVVDVGPDAAVTVARIPLPLDKAQTNLESLSIATVGGSTVLVYADRGDPGAAVVGAVRYDPATSTLIGTPTYATIPRPAWAGDKWRVLSDLALDGAGGVLASSAYDPGDDGPFQAVVWQPFTLDVLNGTPVLTVAPSPARLLGVSTRKTEGLTLLPGADGGLLLVSDDEKAGGQIRGSIRVE